MYMIFHGDRNDMLADDPVFFETLSAAAEYALDRLAKPISKGHALILYRCDVQRVFEPSESLTAR
jgi:hypothetical protein